MSFSVFSLFFQKLAFQLFKKLLKNLLFIYTFIFSAFQLKNPTKKQEQTGLSEA
jgi:hypothetical protein